MQFSYPVETQPNTAISSPTRTQVKLCIGRIEKVSVYFPWGCAGLVGVRILHYEHQLWPTNIDDWYTGNEIPIEFAEEYLVLEGPNEFKVESYNLDNFYPHTPVVSFSVLRGGLYIPETGSWMEA